MRLLMTTSNCATKEDSQRSVCQEDAYLTLTGQPYKMTRINPSIKPVKQEDPTETTVTPAAPTEVEGPPSSCLRSKTKQQSITIKQEQLECNPASLDPLEHNPANVELNNVQVDTEDKNTHVQMALALLGVTKAILGQF